jgi:FimV-like protein
METETLQLFDSYARGTLAEAEKKNFEAKLVSDPEFKKEFEEYLHIVNGICEYEKEQIKAHMKDASHRQLEAHSTWRSMRGVAAAAAVILILVIPGYVIFRMTTSTSRLAKEYYIEDPGLPVVMGASTHSLLDQAMIEYKDKEFNKALEKLNMLLGSKPGNDTLNYYAGLCSYEINQNDNAISFFSKVGDPASAFYFQAKYNLALALIKKGDQETACKALQEVANGAAGSLKDKASELLNKL